MDCGLVHQGGLDTPDGARAAHVCFVTRWPANFLSSRRIAAAIVLGLTFWLIRSFMIPLIWAAVFATANGPLYRRCAQHVPEAMRAHVLPLAFSILITFLVLGPIVGRRRCWSPRKGDSMTRGSHTHYRSDNVR